MAQWDSYSALTAKLGNLTLLIRDSGQANPSQEIRTVTDAQLLEFLIDAAPSLLIPRNGQMLNGKISPTVSANDLILTLQTASGGTPSSSDKVYININGTVRTVTAATSCTLVDATNWMNLGGSEMATKEVDLFAYAIWDSNSSVVAIAPARIPYGRLVSDFNSTNTNERYLGNYANYTSTDNVCVIGRFAATLSAGAGYTWTVPTYTGSNLIQEPIFETRWLDWTPTLAGWSANPTFVVAYRVKNYAVDYIVTTTVTGTSNATTATLTLPFTALNSSLVFWNVGGRGQDNGTEITPSLRVNANTNVLDAYKGPGNTAFTNSGTKFFNGQGSYRIA